MIVGSRLNNRRTSIKQWEAKHGLTPSEDAPGPVEHAVQTRIGYSMQGRTSLAGGQTRPSHADAGITVSKHGPVLSDTTNRRWTTGAGGGWVSGPIRRDSIIKIPEGSPIRTPSPRAPPGVVQSHVEPIKSRKQILTTTWVESPSPAKPVARMPKIEGDGTLVFSDDELESPLKQHFRAAVVRSPVDKSLRRVAELSPRVSVDKSSKFRPCVISPEASAMKASKESRWKREPSKLVRQVPSAHPSTHSVASLATPSEASSVSGAVDSIFDAEERRKEMENEELDESVTMSSGHDWDESAAASSRFRIPAIFIPPSPGTFNRCTLLRQASGLNRIQPKYFLYLEQPHRKPELILMAKKKGIGATATYWMFDMRGLTEDATVDHLSSKHPRFLGKVCSVSKKSSAFVIYGKGKSLKSVTSVKGVSEVEMLSTLRPELGAVCFTLPTVMQKLKHEVGPRTVIALFPPRTVPPRVTVPKTKDAYGSRIEMEDQDAAAANILVEGARTGFKTLLERRSLASRILEKRYEPDMSLLVSKEPTLCNGVFQLNFGGRVKVASIKNFQLVNPDDVHEVLLQFGKTSDDTFSLDFKEPYTILQSFGLSLCQFIA